MREHDLASVQTLLIARLNARGVAILAGSDAPVEGLFPGLSLHQELQELVAAGVPPIDALRSATASAADFLERFVPRARRSGRIEVGAIADLVLLEADPTTDITNTLELRGTMSRGAWHDIGTLQRARIEATRETPDARPFEASRQSPMTRF